MRSDKPIHELRGKKPLYHLAIVLLVLLKNENE